MTSFAELTKRVHSINDLILTDMISVRKDYIEESMEFRSRLLVTTNWFSRISWANKKRFILALISDVRSMWTLSLVLKALWNCRPKDAVISVSQRRIWSSYDQVPMDHNRTALPLSTLKEVMTKDRKWFMSLEPESQAILICELLMISGGPIMWEVLKCAQSTYDAYLERELKNIQEFNVVNETVAEKTKATPDSVRKEAAPRKVVSGGQQSESGKLHVGDAQKDLDASLAAWNTTIKSMRDRLKLEELEMVFSNGTKKKVWKVNRPKPEVTETVDFVQLLPSEIGKKILLYLPTTQLTDCARVNKYWSYLVDELKSELAARQKINTELEKLKEIVLRHATNLDLLARPEFQLYDGSSPDTITDSRKTKTQISNRLCTKSNTLPIKQEIHIENVQTRLPQKPLKNFAELSERLERRGAADENLWKWCENILSDCKQTCKEECKHETKDLVPLESTRFPCPMMKHRLSVPLKTPLIKDPIESVIVKSTIHMPRGDHHDTNVKLDQKRYYLWSKDMSGLYPVTKLPSYKFPM